MVREYLMFETLRNMTSEFKLIPNVYLPKQDVTTTEIDLILVHRTGFYVFESKHYSGQIFGSEDRGYWTQTLNSRNKYQFINPIYQNDHHIKVLKEHFPQYEHILFLSLVIFSDKSKLQNIVVNKPNIVVIHLKDLPSTLQSLFVARRTHLSPNQIEDVVGYLKKFSKVSNEIKMKHVNDLTQAYSGHDELLSQQKLRFNFKILDINEPSIDRKMFNKISSIIIII